MAPGAPINAQSLFSDDASVLLGDAGAPHYNRRLTDKILAAFNHAYAMGELDLARTLWECLQAAERLGQMEFARRRPNQALDLASEWVAFVDARDRYREISQLPADTANTARAFQEMREAYEAWRRQNAPAAEVPPPANAGRERGDAPPESA